MLRTGVCRAARRRRTRLALSSPSESIATSAAPRAIASSPPTAPLWPLRKSSPASGRVALAPLTLPGGRRPWRRGFPYSRVAAPATASRSLPGAVGDHRQPGGAGSPDHVRQAARERSQLDARATAPPRGGSQSAAPPARVCRRSRTAPAVARRHRRGDAPHARARGSASRCQDGARAGVPATPARRRRARARRRTDPRASARCGGSPC